MADGNVNIKMIVDTSQVETNLKKILEQLKEFENLKGDKAVGMLDSISASLKDISKNAGLSSIYDIVKGFTDIYSTLEKVSKMYSTYTEILGIHKLKQNESSVATTQAVAAKVANQLATEGMVVAETAEALSTGIATGAKQQSTIATGLYTIATNIAAAASTAFGVAMEMMGGPIGLAVVAIGAIVGGLLLFGSGLDSHNEKISAAEEKQKMLNQMFDESRINAENCETSYSRLADEVLPKLKTSWDEMNTSLMKYDMTGNADQLKNLASGTDEYISTIKDSLTTYYDDIFTGMTNYYTESGTLDEEQSQNNLKRLAEIQQEELDKVDEHRNQLLLLQNKLDETGVLNEEEQEQYRGHLAALSQIATETITPEQARRIAEQENFLSRQGDLNEEEQDKLAESLRKSEAEKKGIIEESYGQTLATNEELYAALIKAAEGDAAEVEKLENEKKDMRDGILKQMNAEIEANTDEHYNKMVLGVTGYSADELAEYNALKDQQEIVAKAINNQQEGYNDEKLTELKKTLDQEMAAYDIQDGKIDELNDLMGKKGNENYKTMWDSQVEKSKEGRKSIVEQYETVSKEGQKEVKNSKKGFVSAAGDIVSGIAKGIGDGVGTAVKAVGDLAGSMLGGIKSFFGISSPSKVMRKLMKWVPIGGALGIEDETNTMVDAASDMVEDVLATTADLADEMAAVGSEAIEALSDSFEQDMSMDKEIGLYLSNSFDSVFTRFADAITKGVDKLVNTPLHIGEMTSIPGLPLNGIVNIPRASIPYQDAMYASNGHQEMSDVLQALIVNGDNNQKDSPINLYIDGELLFRWMNKKKRTFEFATNGGKL